MPRSFALSPRQIYLPALLLCAILVPLLLLFGRPPGQSELFLRGDTIPIHSQQVRTMMGSLQMQIDSTQEYDASYASIDYPGGDVPLYTGVCADVVVRALRSIGTDLQKEMHVDMKGNFSKYPQRWGLSGPDRNIDHRRVANQMVFFKREGKSRTISDDGKDYLPGDIVCWKLPGNRHHTGMVTSIRSSSSGAPLIAHNIGRGTELHDALFAWEIIGHYRWVE